MRRRCCLATPSERRRFCAFVPVEKAPASVCVALFGYADLLDHLPYSLSTARVCGGRLARTSQRIRRQEFSDRNYLETLREDEKIGGAVFLAGWVNLTEAAYETNEDAMIAKPWLETPLDWDRIRSRAAKFAAVFSDDDPLVPLSDSQIFEEHLDAQIIIERGKGHFSGSSGILELPSALEAVLAVANSGQ